MAFNSETIVHALQTVYGLPASFFTIKSVRVIALTDGTTIQLIPYSNYTNYEGLDSSKKTLFIFEDQWFQKQAIIVSKIKWLCDYQNKLNARNCIGLKVEKAMAISFLNTHHLMNYADSAYHYGLIHDKQLVALATFSKGRKMNRLADDKKSFELIRYAAVTDTTVTGGLSKLLQLFAVDHTPGDIMTYIDVLWGNTLAFQKNGFIVAGQTNPVTLYVNTQTHTRYFKQPVSSANIIAFQNQGNYKLIKPYNA